MFPTLALISAMIWAFGWKSKGKFPPGPPPMPIIGNLLDMPTNMEYIKYMEWAQEYGMLFFSFTTVELVWLLPVE